MGIIQAMNVGFLVAFAKAQATLPCSLDSSLWTVASSEDAASLATSLRCSDGDFAVQWVGSVIVTETIRVTNGTSLNITGDGSGATADGDHTTQLFVVEGGSSMHFTDMTFANGNASSGGAMFVGESSVRFSGATAFTGNVAADDPTDDGGHGGAIFVAYSTLVFDGSGDATFNSNSASRDGGAVYALWSGISWQISESSVFSDNTADRNGGAIYTHGSTVSWDGDGTHFSYNSANAGGAVYAYESTVSWNGDGTYLGSNTAYDGGAIYADASTVSWDGYGTEFSHNSVDSLVGQGGAIHAAAGSTVYWDGDGTEFSFNSAGSDGGAIYTEDSTVYWDGDDTIFTHSSGGQGGSIRAYDSTLSWTGDGTQFSSSSSSEGGGAMYATRTNLFWDGNRTHFSNNSATFEGGAIRVSTSSTASWHGETTFFSNNSAGDNGGAIDVDFEGSLWCDGNTIFSNNVAGVNGGALAVTGVVNMFGGAFVGNTAAGNGGAIHMLDNEIGYYFEDVTLQSNSATNGGAVAAYGTGNEGTVTGTFSRCSFLGNTASKNGGAVEIFGQSGQQQFASSLFEGNSADVGGALSLIGSTGNVSGCSFLSNSASTRGFAIAVAGSATIGRSSFEDNALTCAAGFFLQDIHEEEGTSTSRYEAACLDCPDWEECRNCTIETADVVPTCSRPLEHTTADESGVTFETLSISPGYWRATNQSDNILACFNADACNGGETGAAHFCDNGYMGPYCAVCGDGYSPSLAHTCTRCSSSRRQGLMVATVFAALVAVGAIVATFRYLLSTEVEERNIGCFHRRIFRAIPLQAFKIIIVVWQILTQFAAAANVTYPGVYQNFLSAIDVINFDLGSMISAGCLWSGIDFHDRLLVSTVGPLLAIGMLALSYLVALRRNATAGHDVIEKIRQKHVTVLLFVTFLVYSSVSSMVFQTFACDSLDDGNNYLRADYRILCTTAKHLAFQVYAGVMVVVYPVGVPLLYAIMLLQHRAILTNASADKTAAQPIASLWEAYKPERFYYEVIECGRRIMLTGVVVFIFPNDAAQIAITILIAVFFFAVFDILSPYASEFDMWLSRGGQVVVFLSMFDLLLLKVDVSHERSQSQQAYAGVLVAGHVLMFLAIFFEVVGICYASRRNRVMEEDKAFLSFPGLRAHRTSDETPVFERSPAS